MGVVVSYRGFGFGSGFGFGCECDCKVSVRAARTVGRCLASALAGRSPFLFLIYRVGGFRCFGLARSGLSGSDRTCHLPDCAHFCISAFSLTIVSDRSAKLPSLVVFDLPFSFAAGCPPTRASEKGLRRVSSAAAVNEAPVPVSVSVPEPVPVQDSLV